MEVVIFLICSALLQIGSGFTTGSKGSCGGNFTARDGEFASPDYPNAYPDYSDCTWNIQAPDHKFIALRFRNVDIEYTNGCRFDAVRVYDGESGAYPLLGSVCGSQSRLFSSSGNKLTVMFISDNYGTGKGFIAHWTFTDYPETATPDYPTTPDSHLRTTADGATPDTDWTTVADYSCMYNCGYNFSACSCATSCQYYGTCCYDYYDHCFTATTATTTTTDVVTDDWVTEDYVSCWNRCGQHGALCSCSSSCQYYGGCCSDYNYYCSASTPDTSTANSLPTTGACGGRHHGSGSISSPYYPNYYHDNADCVWQLSAPAGQTIFLSFLDIDLERCCSCDYVNVYDGPSTASRLIEKVCYNDTNHLDFQSSSSYMTVQFRSDYSGVGRGFKAQFSSSLDKNTGHVDCSSDWMKISIRKSYLDSLGFSWHDLYLDDHRCRPSTDYNVVTFNFPLHSCSTRRKTDNGRIIYSNNVRSASSTSGEITRHETKFLMLVHCVMERDSSVGTLYEAKEITNATIGGTGRFNTTMAFYPSNSFSYPITESPYRVNLAQNLYVQVQLSRAEPSLHLFIDSCVASPNHDFSSRTYDLISNGCRRDSTVYIYRNGYQYFAQFSFQAFKFLRTHNQVFLRCDVVICADNDYNSRCRQGCRNRRKRSASSDHHTEVVTLGPITLKGPNEAVAITEDEK